MWTTSWQGNTLVVSRGISGCRGMTGSAPSTAVGLSTYAVASTSVSAKVLRSDGTPPHIAQAPTEMRMSQFSRKCTRVSMFSSFATPPSTNPIAQRSGIRLMSVSEERRIVTLSSSGRIRSSMSRMDSVHPQQPHNEIVEILILSARWAACSGGPRRCAAARANRSRGHGVSVTVASLPTSGRGPSGPRTGGPRSGCRDRPASRGWPRPDRCSPPP